MSEPSSQSPKKAAWARYSPPVVALLLILTICDLVLNFKEPGISKPAAGLVESLVWPSLVIILLLYFRIQMENLLAILTEKIRTATKFQIANVGFEVGAETIPLPKSGEPVTLENVALLHTSFLRSDKTQAYADGRNYYQVEVVVVAPPSTLDEIESVTYRLDKAYKKDNPRTTVDRQGRFKLKDLANGTSIVRAELRFKGQDQPLYLNRFIDLRPTGPRI